MPRQRLEGVDVLRGLSVLLVLLHHIHLRFWINDYPVDGVLPATLNRLLFWSGYYAVIMFFVISGFLITGLSMRRWGELRHIRPGPFYRLRVARILPTLLLVLLASALLHRAGVREFVIDPSRASLGGALWSALTFHLNLLEGRHGYLPGNWDVLWSLSVEESFYLIFPLACLLLRRSWMLAALVAGLLLAGPVTRTLLAAEEPWNQYAYLACTDALALGCLTAWACAHWPAGRRALLAALGIGAALSAAVLIGCSEDGHTGLARYGLNVTCLAAGVALMLRAFGGGVGNRLLSQGTRWLRTIGDCSYEIYLAHMFVILGLMNAFRALSPPLRVIPLWYAAMLIASIGLGYLLARGYSGPMNAWLRRFPAARS